MTPERIQYISNLLVNAAYEVRHDLTDVGSALAGAQEALGLLRELDMRNIAATHHC